MDEQVRKQEQEQRQEQEQEQEMEQLRAALEAAHEEVAKLSEERSLMKRNAVLQARELRALHDAQERVLKLAHDAEPDAERERLLMTEEELRISLEELQVLAEELEATNSSIRGMNVQLEQRVEERTQQIEESRAALSESELRFRSLLEGIPQLVWKSAAGGNWTWCSAQWCAFTGQTFERSLGHGWLDVIHPGDRGPFTEAWEAAGEAGHFSVEHRTWNAGQNDWRWMQSRASPVPNHREQIVEWVGSSTDIEEQVIAREVLTRSGVELEARVADRTRELEQALARLKEQIEVRERAEQGLRQSEKLKAIGQLTGGIAHDLNNMLQSISGSLSMIRTRLRQERYGEINSYLERASTGVNRAASLTQRLLTFARKQELSPEPLSLKWIAYNMEELIRHTVGPGVQVELKLGDGDWLVMCDSNQMESALLNLAINARDAMPEGGWLTITTEVLQLSADQLTAAEDAQPGSYGAIAVTDTGTGMPPEVVARIFEPFFTTKPQGKGTGLGLSQIYGFIRQSGGVIQVETVPGLGTTIRLCLPLEAQDEAVADPASGTTVLLVEDETDVREMIAEYMRDAGFKVVEAENGAAALRILQSHSKPDFLVSDYGLPGGMNGRQVAEAVHERYPGLPVIVITGFTGNDAVQDLDVIYKPFNPGVLVDAIGTILAVQPAAEQRPAGA